MLQATLWPVKTAPFLTALDDLTLSKIHDSEYIVYDLETTALTPQSLPTTLGKGAMIGGETWARYSRLYGAKLDCRPRARILTAGLSDGEKLAFDLDSLSEWDRQRLVRACLHERIVIGHNLGFDYMWSLTLAQGWEPQVTLDTQLLIRCLRPGLPWLLHTQAVDPEARDARAIIESKGTEASASLDAIGVSLGLTKLDKSNQHARNWCPVVLSPGHYDYVLGDVTAPLEVIFRLAGTRDIDAAVLALIEEDKRRGESYFGVYEKLPLELARISHRGIPLHMPTLRAIEAHRAAAVSQLADEVVRHIPLLEPHKPRLASSKSGVSAEVKRALAGYARDHGCILGTGEDGEPEINADAAKIAKADALDGWKAWDKLQHAKKTLASCAEYELASKRLVGNRETQRLHPLLAATTVTARLRAKVPNVQNMVTPEKGVPAELQFRSVITALPNHSIVSADYSQIELRVAAALAVRARREAEAALAGAFQVPLWVLEALKRAQDPSIELVTAGDGFDAYRDGLAAAYRGTLRLGTPLADAFRARVDVHLLTACSMARRQGLITFDEPRALDYLMRSDVDANALKEQLATQRKNAKAPNFGLLYGMQADKLWRMGVVDYGLTWDTTEAAAARAAWFEDFPDVAFWQAWTRCVYVAPKVEAVTLYRRNRYTKALETQEGVRMRTASTLRGRPICTPEIRQALNYQDQGTGADIISDAIVNLPEPVRSFVINIVHDEIVLEVPDHALEVAKAQLRETMLAAADRALAPYGIPADVDVSVSRSWE